MKREASPLMKRENPTPGLRFCGLSTHEPQTTRPALGDFQLASDKRTLSDLISNTGEALRRKFWVPKRHVDRHQHDEARGVIG
jgi:hypothetical protein